MIQHRRAVGSPIPTRLLVSSRTYEDIIYRDELEREAEAGMALEVIHTLTRTQPPGWTGYGRRIDAEFLRNIAWPVDQHPLASFSCPTPSSKPAPANLLSLGSVP